MIDTIKKFWNKNKIRKRLILYFMATTILMGITSLYSYYSVSMLMTKVNSTFTSNVRLNELYSNVNQVEKNLESYLTSKHSKSLEDYYKSFDELKQKADRIKIDSLPDESSLLMKDIKNMIDNYLQETDAAVKSKRGRDIYEYVFHYNEATKILGYINVYINKLNNIQLQENTNKYMAVASKISFLELLNVGIIIGVIVFNIIFILWVTYKTTKPIIRLSHSADEISKGNFDIEQVNVDTHDEISVMANAFNRMTASIKLYINEIKEKAKLESRLKEQEMQNLIMKTHLKEAELQALQSQINPHFLFNTLNAGAQLAMLEGADRTCTFVENVAELFRYNLRKLDKPSTLREEINNIHNYVYILKARFADRLEFSYEIDENILDIPMPCMILQPLVENAFIHGIGELEAGGRISLRVKKAEDGVEISIKDNGKGMSQKKITDILECKGEEKKAGEQIKSGHTTGIGMNNVISRLRIFYNTEHILNIYSNESQGTEFVLRIPAVI